MKRFPRTERCGAASLRALSQVDTDDRAGWCDAETGAFEMQVAESRVAESAAERLDGKKRKPQQLFGACARAPNVDNAARFA